jgi:hypothetical protein
LGAGGMSAVYNKFVAEVRGPLGSVRSCRLCPKSKPFCVVLKRGAGGFVGGNKARGAMIQHIKDAHPAEYAAAMAEARAKD